MRVRVREMEFGFLGLGIMGKAMAINLLRHGFKVTIWNRTLSKVYTLYICYSFSSAYTLIELSRFSGFFFIIMFLCVRVLVMISLHNILVDCYG